MHAKLMWRAIVFTGLLLMSVSSAVAAPRLVLSESEFNFGFAPQNSQLSHVFWMHSKGDDTLKIIQVVPGCGCTRAPIDKDVLPVGDSTRLEIIFDTRSYAGQVTKTPHVQTNDGPPDKTIRFNADVITRPDSTYPIVIRPYKLDLMQFGEKTRDNITFAIVNVSDKPLEASVVSSPEDLLTVTLPKLLPAGKTSSATVKLKKGALDKPFEKSITIQLNDDKATRFTIPVKRAIRSATDSPASSGVKAGSSGGH